ncbi:MAG: BACON domain-containing protein [Bacteroidales bacterium]|nr:BACON domain-containing protein [Bacteroidales bacterium]
MKMTAKKIRTLFFAICASGLLLTQFWGCEQYVLPEISLNPDTLRFTAAGGVLPVQVQANVKWQLSVSDEGTGWLTAGAESGNGNLTVGIEAGANADDERTCTVIVRSETIRKQLTVIQASGL